MNNDGVAGGRPGRKSAGARVGLLNSESSDKSFIRVCRRHSRCELRHMPHKIDTRTIRFSLAESVCPDQGRSAGVVVVRLSNSSGSTEVSGRFVRL